MFDIDIAKPFEALEIYIDAKDDQLYYDISKLTDWDRRSLYEKLNIMDKRDCTIIDRYKEELNWELLIEYTDLSVLDPIKFLDGYISYIGKENTSSFIKKYNLEVTEEFIEKYKAYINMKGLFSITKDKEIINNHIDEIDPLNILLQYYDATDRFNIIRKYKDKFKKNKVLDEYVYIFGDYSIEQYGYLIENGFLTFSLGLLSHILINVESSITQEFIDRIIVRAIDNGFLKNLDERNQDRFWYEISMIKNLKPEFIDNYIKEFLNSECLEHMCIVNKNIGFFKKLKYLFLIHKRFMNEVT